MAKRCNVRSFRYSDQIAQILREYGTPYMSVNRKFEALILESWVMLPEIRKRISAAQQELDELQSQCRSWRAKYTDLQMLARQISELSVSVSILSRRLDDLAYNRNL